jgi:hypothetical protein
MQSMLPGRNSVVIKSIVLKRILVVHNACGERERNSMLHCYSSCGLLVELNARESFTQSMHMHTYMLCTAA